LLSWINEESGETGPAFDFLRTPGSNMAKLERTRTGIDAFQAAFALASRAPERVAASQGLHGSGGAR
jgi:hypothetical protein